MNKKTKTMLRRAEQDNMMYIVPIEATDIKKLSKKAAGVVYCNCRADYDPFTLILEGSAADIRKGIKYVERLGVSPFYNHAPILREGRTYVLGAEDGYWSVGRIIERTGLMDSTEPYDYIVEPYDNSSFYNDCNFDFDDCEPEAIEGEFYEV